MTDSARLFLDLWAEADETVGFEVVLPIEVGTAVDVPLLDSGWTLSLTADASVVSGVTGTWRWGEEPEITGTGDEDTHASVELMLQRGPGALLSIPGGPALLADQIELTAGVEVPPVSPGGAVTLQHSYSAALRGVVLEAMPTDALLASLFDSLAIGPVDLDVGWSPATASTSRANLGWRSACRSRSRSDRFPSAA